MKEHINKPFDKATLAVLGVILVAFVAFVSFWLGGTTVYLQLNQDEAFAKFMSNCVPVRSEGMVYVMCPVGVPSATYQAPAILPPAEEPLAQ